MLLMKNENPIFLVIQSYLRSRLIKNVWVSSIRAQTLIAGISPVMIGSAIASIYQPIIGWVFALSLLFSLLLQIGTNWANDYFDFIKNADTCARKGPHRAIQTQKISPKTMRNASFGIFFLAACISFPLIARIGLHFIPFMMLCIFCAIFYTAGKRPLGYMGFGDLLVFLFYGPIATCCTILAQILFIPSESWIAALIPGCMSCAILCLNNMRDIDEDRRANKLTLVARFGLRFGKAEYGACLFIAALAPLLLVWHGWPTTFLIVWLVLPLAIEPLQIAFQLCGDLNRALALTARMFAIYTIILCMAIYAHLYI